MGLNLHVETKAGERYPKWDWIRHVGDRQFCELRRELPHDAERQDSGHGDFDWRWRPKDFSAWRDAIVSRNLENRERFDGLLTLLEQEPTLWLYESW